MRGRAARLAFALVATLLGITLAWAQPAIFEAGRLRFTGPEGFCAVDPGRGGHHPSYWRNFAPPPERKATMLALGLDCATLDLDRIRRPNALLQLVESRDPSLPADREAALRTLETRFGTPVLAAKAPPLGRDEFAVYVAQRAKDGPSGGVSAFTVMPDGRLLIFTIMHFDGPRPPEVLRAEVARVVRELRG